MAAETRTGVSVALQGSPLRGIALYVAGVLLFVVMDSLAKHLTASYPVMQVVWARYTFHALPILVFFGPRHGLALVRTERLGLQVLRALFLLGATLSFFTAISYIPLADASAIAITSPFIVVGLSVVVLGEKVGVRRWIAVAVGFLGAVIILRPGLGAVHPAAFLVLLVAIFFALYQIATRLLAFTENSLATLFYTSLVGVAVMAFVAPFFWKAPDATGWALMVAIGSVGAIAHFVFIKAFAFAAASTLAPFAYAQLIWATLFGFVLFSDIPDRWTVGGAAVVAASGLYILYRERAGRMAATVPVRR